MKGRPLRIGVDARELLGDATGVGRYLSELLRRWTARPDAESRRFVLYAPAPIPLPLPADAAETRVLASNGAGTWWEQTALRSAARREPLDAFFAPGYTAPLGLTVPLALTIHDVSFMAHPEWFRPRERLRRRWLTARSVRAASVVLTDSQFSRDEIVAHLPIDPARIAVVPPGVSARHLHSPGEGRREPLVLFVGSLFNRRRLPHLIRSFAGAAAAVQGARLAIVGADRTWPAEDLEAVAAAAGVSDRLDLRNYVSDAELATLYARASVFAFLSEYEGFGLTPLEALAAGVPILVLDTAVAREVYGPAATYLPATASAEETATVLRALLSSPAGADTMRHAGAVLARYRWDEAAERTLAEIERAAGQRK